MARDAGCDCMVKQLSDGVEFVAFRFARSTEALAVPTEFIDERIAVVVHQGESMEAGARTKLVIWLLVAKRCPGRRWRVPGRRPA